MSEMGKTIETPGVNRREFLAAALKEGALLAGMGLMAPGEASAKTPEGRMIQTSINVPEDVVMAISPSTPNASVIVDTVQGDTIVRSTKVGSLPSDRNIALMKGDVLKKGGSEPQTFIDNAEVRLEKGDTAELLGSPRRIRLPSGYTLTTVKAGPRVLLSSDPAKVSVEIVSGAPKPVKSEEQRKKAIEAKLKRLQPGIEEVQRKFGRFGIKLVANPDDGTVVVEGLEKNGINEPKVRIAPGESLDIEYTLDGRTWRKLPLPKTPERRAIAGVKEDLMYGEFMLSRARWGALGVQQEAVPSGQDERFRPRKPPAGSPRSAY